MGTMIQLMQLVQPELVTLALFLSIEGMVLKYLTPLDNKLIPVVLWGSAFAIASTAGWVHSVGPKWYDGLVTGGLVNGTIAAAFSIMLWDTLRGLYKKFIGGKK